MHRATRPKQPLPAIDPRLARLAERLVVQPRVAPGVVLCLAVRRDGGWELAQGSAGVLSDLRQEAVAIDTPFDLASVTKPFVAISAARLAARRELDLDAPIGTYVEEARGTPSETVPLELFLAHRAGLDAHRPLFAPLVDGRAFLRREAVRAAAEARREDCAGTPAKEGFEPLYSDLGFVLAGVALEGVARNELDAIVENEVGAPLGLDVGSARQWRSRNSTFDDRVAPTETVDWRGGSIVAEVHDENAWAMGGDGMAGQAGLFGTAEAVARFGTALLDARGGRTEWLLPGDLERLLRPRPGGSLLAGFDGKSASGSSAGSKLSASSFGHLGFTGTSLWCDPDAELVAVVLSNRVCPTRDHIAIRAARPAIHDAMFEVATAVRLRR